MRPARSFVLALLVLFAYAEARDIPDIPRGSWQRNIGDVPLECQSNCPNRGIALGGFGAGSFMYNISGSFGPWADEVGEYDQIWLREAAFHVFERKGKSAMAKCLSTDSVLMPAWNRIHVGDGTYYALQPKGWCVYHCFDCDVSSEFFSPIIPHNYRETSYPVAVWEFDISNPAEEPAEVAVMLTWPNPPFSGGSWVRTGFTSQAREQSGVLGIVLKASHPNNPAETQNSEWCIATVKTDDLIVSFASWDRSKSGNDIWRQFADDGVLSDSINPVDSAAALAVKCTLLPGTDIVVPIVISWDFPVVEFGGGCAMGGDEYAEGQGTQWWKRYCEYFDTLSDNSFDIAVEALQNYRSWEKQIDAWMSPFINDVRYPDWLLCAAFNELYYNQFGGSFWESGLRSGHPEEFMALHPQDHKNFIMESQRYTLSGNINVGHYSSVVYARFWPEMERDLMRCHADVVTHYDECSPSLPHQTSPEIGAPRGHPRFPCSVGDPFFAMNHHRYLSRPVPCAAGRFHVLTDNSSKFIQRCWRYHSLYEDMEFLEYVWPAVESTYHFMRAYDCETEPRDSLPCAQGYDNTYDSWAMYGTDMYSGGLWIGALEATDTMAAILGKPVREEVQAWLEASKRNLDAGLWDSTGSYYRIDADSEYPTAIFSDALCGQRYCESFGLPDILPSWKMTSHLAKVYEINVSPNSNFGAKLGRLPDGSTVPSGDRYTLEYWVGTTYYVAAMMHHAGLKEEALKAAYGAYYPVYEADHLAYWFNTPEAWQDSGLKPRPISFSPLRDDHWSDGAFPLGDETGAVPASQACPHQYQRARAVWELMFEIQQDRAFSQRGDADKSGVLDVADVICLLGYLYRIGPSPMPLEAGDANCDGLADLEDVLYLLNYLFKDGPEPAC